MLSKSFFSSHDSNYQDSELYSKNFLIVGLTRNCSSNIKNDIAKFQSAIKNFNNISWLIIESDSSDNTVETLKELETEVINFRFISLGALAPIIPLRTERIAHCRNKYLDEFRNNPIYENIDYLVVADLDGLNDKLTENAFLSCWLRNDWDVCTANQSGPYYDIYALRHPFWSVNDCVKSYNFFINLKFSAEKSKEIAILSKMIKIDQNTDWIEVESAFGGLAIYKKDAINTAYYIGIDNDGTEMCEHVNFHKMLRENGKRIFINPKFINADFTEHTLQLKRFTRLKIKIKQLVRAF